MRFLSSVLGQQSSHWCISIRAFSTSFKLRSHWCSCWSSWLTTLGSVSLSSSEPWSGISCLDGRNQLLLMSPSIVIDSLPAPFIVLFAVSNQHWDKSLFALISWGFCGFDWESWEGFYRSKDGEVPIAKRFLISKDSHLWHNFAIFYITIES